MRSSVNRLAAAAAAAAALAAAAVPAGTPASGSPLVFGRAGGNIRPYTVTIAADGRVSASGAARLTVPGYALSPVALRGLRKLATAEGFFTMPRTIRCPRVLPDIASLFVTFRSSAGTRTVSETGSCTPGFEELYAVLLAASGVSA